MISDVEPASRDQWHLMAVIDVVSRLPPQATRDTVIAAFPAPLRTADDTRCFSPPIQLSAWVQQQIFDENLPLKLWWEFTIKSIKIYHLNFEENLSLEVCDVYERHFVCKVIFEIFCFCNCIFLFSSILSSSRIIALPWICRLQAFLLSAVTS